MVLHWAINKLCRVRTCKSSMKLPVLFTKFSRLLPASRKKEKAEVSCIRLQLMSCRDPRRVRTQLVFTNDNPNPALAGGHQAMSFAGQALLLFIQEEGRRDVTIYFCENTSTVKSFISSGTVSV